MRPTGLPVTPESQLTAFLEKMISTRVPSEGFLKGVYVDDPTRSGAPDRNYWLADFAVLPAAVTTDSALGSAVVTTVAVVVLDLYSPPDAVGWTSRIQIQEDTVHWRMAKDSAYGWLVVDQGFTGSPTARTEFAFGRGGPRNRWEPATTSNKTAMALVDSIRKARGHPILR